ncbi:MAG: hypothetical protein ACLFPQ_06120 [Candidatus Woesearchaeota archaeon]
MVLDAVVDCVFRNEDEKVCVTFRGMGGVLLEDYHNWFFSIPNSYKKAHDVLDKIFSDRNLLHKNLKILPGQDNIFALLLPAEKWKYLRDNYFSYGTLKDKYGDVQYTRKGKKRKKKIPYFNPYFWPQFKHIANVGEILSFDDEFYDSIKDEIVPVKMDDFNPEHKGFVDWDYVLKEGIAYFDTEQPLFKRPEKSTSHLGIMFDSGSDSFGEYHTVRDFRDESVKGFSVNVHDDEKLMADNVSEKILKEDPWVLVASNIPHDLYELRDTNDFPVGGDGFKRKYWISSGLDFPKSVKMHRRLLIDTVRIAEYAVSFLGSKGLKAFTSYALSGDEKKMDVSYDELEEIELKLINDPENNQDLARLVAQYQVMDVTSLKSLIDIGFGEDLCFLSKWSGRGLDAVMRRSWIKEYWDHLFIEKVGMSRIIKEPKLEERIKGKETFWKRYRYEENAKLDFKKEISNDVFSEMGSPRVGVYEDSFAYFVSYSDAFRDIMTAIDPKISELYDFRDSINCEDYRHNALRKMHIDGVINALIKPVVVDYYNYKRRADDLSSKIKDKNLPKKEMGRILNSAARYLGRWDHSRLRKNHNLNLNRYGLRVDFDDFRKIKRKSRIVSSDNDDYAEFVDLLSDFVELKEHYMNSKNSYGFRIEVMGENLRQNLNGLKDHIDSQDARYLGNYGSVIFLDKRINTDGTNMIYLGSPDILKVEPKRTIYEMAGKIKGARRKKPGKQLEMF